MAKAKKEKLSLEELLEQALVKEEDQPYEVPSNWVWVKFSCIAKEMADGPFGSNLKKEHYTDEKEVRIIQLSNIGEDGWREENTKYTTFKHAETISRSIVPAGGVVIAKMMPAGRAIIVPDNEKMYVLSSDAVKVIPQDCIDVRYLVSGINSTFFRNQIQANTQGITRARTSIGKLKEYAFPLPPLAEQQRIVERIESLFEKLDTAKELAQKALDSFENRKAAILHKAFTGELTAKWREENGVSLDSWEEKKLKEICKISSGGTPSRKNPEYYTGNIPWIKTGEIKWNYIENAEEKITPEAIANSSAKLFEKGTVLVAMYGQGLTRGRAAILNIDATTNQAVCALRVGKCSLSRFIYYYFMYNYWKFREEAVGGNQPNLSGTIISGFTINLPSLQEQQEIISIIDILLEKEQQAQELCNIIERVNLMKKAILARAFRGELGTNNTEEESAIELLKEVLKEKL